MNNNNPTQSTFDILSAIDVTPYVEKKQNGLSYLSWAWAWKLVKTNFPDATFEKHYWDGKPYLFDPDLGYYVETSVTINGETQTMNLLVMDGANKAMTNHPYTYMTKYGEKSVEAATMFDINTALQRCLVKTLSLFGLGLSLYTGEDINHDQQQQQAPPKQAKKPAQTSQPMSQPQPTASPLGISNQIKACMTPEALLELYNQHQNQVEADPNIKNLFKLRKLEIQLAA